MIPPGAPGHARSRSPTTPLPLPRAPDRIGGRPVRRARRAPIPATRITIPYRHPLVEDAGAVLVSGFLLAWGLFLLHAVGGVSGGLAGVSFVLSYATGLPLGAVFFVVNVPFYYFAVRRMGWGFTLKTFLVVTLASAVTSALPAVVTLERIDPLFACTFSGLSIGLGMLVIFRHGASAGGFGIVAAYAQERFGWRAGYVQGALDLLLLATSIPLVSPLVLVYSIVGAVVLNLVLAVNHRPGRYRP